MKLYVWVTFDRSNGNSHEPWPTYIWADKTREIARQRLKIHAQNPSYARLEGPPRKMSRVALTKRGYFSTPGSVSPEYLSRSR